MYYYYDCISWRYYKSRRWEGEAKKKCARGTFFYLRCIHITTTLFGWIRLANEDLPISPFFLFCRYKNRLKNFLRAKSIGVSVVGKHRELCWDDDDGGRTRWPSYLLNEIKMRHVELGGKCLCVAAKMQEEGDKCQTKKGISYDRSPRNQKTRSLCNRLNQIDNHVSKETLYYLAPLPVFFLYSME